MLIFLPSSWLLLGISQLDCCSVITGICEYKYVVCTNVNISGMDNAINQGTANFFLCRVRQ